MNRSEAPLILVGGATDDPNLLDALSTSGLVSADARVIVLGDVVSPSGDTEALDFAIANGWQVILGARETALMAAAQDPGSSYAQIAGMTLDAHRLFAAGSEKLKTIAALPALACQEWNGVRVAAGYGGFPERYAVRDIISHPARVEMVVFGKTPNESPRGSDVYAVGRPGARSNVRKGVYALGSSGKDPVINALSIGHKAVWKVGRQGADIIRIEESAEERLASG